jgi:outer membrane protein assembly factor BamB
MKRRTVCRILWAIASLLCGGAWPGIQTRADWPQVLGPNRDGWAAAGEQLGDWTTNPPQIAWQRAVGPGYAGAAIVDRTAIVIHRQGKTDLIERLQLENGQLLWQTTVDETYGSGADPDAGPRCTPVVADGIVLCTTAAGDLHALSLADGQLLWTRALREETNAGDGYFGASTTPLVVDQTIVAIVGGTRGRAVMGLNLKSGETLWKAGDGKAEYASPIVVTIDGAAAAICPLQTETIAVRVSDGAVLWQTPYGTRGAKVIAATPLKTPAETIFLTAEYGIHAKSVWIRDGREHWSSKDAISSQFVTPILADGYLYGCHGREDIGSVDIRCCDPMTGKMQWEERRYGVAAWLGVGNELLACGMNGRLDRIAIDPKTFRRTAQFQIPIADGEAKLFRALPALSDGYLIMRSSGLGSHVMALQVR